MFPAAKIAGDENVDADGDAHERVYQQRDKRRRCADRGQRRCTGKLADDNHVRRVEQQLQNTRCCQRKREADDLREQRALRHIYLFNRSRHILSPYLGPFCIIFQIIQEYPALRNVKADAPKLGGRKRYYRACI